MHEVGDGHIVVHPGLPTTCRAPHDTGVSVDVVAIWHGTADSTVVPANATELVDQFTDLAG